MITVPLSPLSNPHESILRRRHLVDGECRTVPAQQRRRQSVAAVQSTTNKLPPTPCKSTVGRGHTRKRRKRIAKFTLSTHNHSHMKKNQSRHAKKITRTPSSNTPSPPKRRKTVHSQFMHALHHQGSSGSGRGSSRLQRTVQSQSCSQLPSLWSLASDSSDASNLHRKSEQKKPRDCRPSASMSAAQKKRYFQSVGVIGVGSFSQVFKVENFETKHVYALKKITTNLNHRDAISDALNEVELMQLLQQQQFHPHLICLRDFWVSRDQHLFELYDYYEHGTLLDFVEHNTRLNHLQILEITRQVCDGLRYVHSLNIIHLDLKPSNIYVTSDFTIKIGDFGISVRVANDKHEGGDDHNELLSHAHNNYTTPSNKYRYSGDPIYIAPELMNFDRNLANVTHKTDIFSLGIILLELLCDINAPSQGIVFLNLRRNIIDFDVVDPSPIVYSKSFKSHQTTSFAERARSNARDIGFSFPHHHQHQDENDDQESEECKKLESGSLNSEHVDATKFTHDDNDVEIHENDDDTNADHNEIISQIDTRMKTLCKQMLQRKSTLRPDCDAILQEIEAMFTDTSNAKYFSQCSNVSTLSLPPLQVAFEDVQSLHRSQSLNTSQCSSTRRGASAKLQLQDLSFCYDSHSLLNDSGLSTRSNTSNGNKPHSTEGTSAAEQEWFYQASPQNMEQILQGVRRRSSRHTDLSSPGSRSAPETGSAAKGSSGRDSYEHDEDEFALDLNSAFEDAKHSPLTPFSLSSLGGQAHGSGGLFAFDFDEHAHSRAMTKQQLFIHANDLQEKKDQDEDQDEDQDHECQDNEDEDDDLYPLASIHEEMNIDDDLTPKQLFV